MQLAIKRAMELIIAVASGIVSSPLLLSALLEMRPFLGSAAIFGNRNLIQRPTRQFGQDR